RAGAQQRQFHRGPFALPRLRRSLAARQRGAPVRVRFLRDRRPLPHVRVRLRAGSASGPPRRDPPRERTGALPVIGVRLFVALFIAWAFATAAPAQGRGGGGGGGTRLLRDPTVSRDLVAFAYAGDLWVVARSGGAA